jgi:hypothetical protein
MEEREPFCFCLYYSPQPKKPFELLVFDILEGIALHCENKLGKEVPIPKPWLFRGAAFALSIDIIRD